VRHAFTASLHDLGIRHHRIQWLGIALLGAVTTFLGMATWTATQGMGDPATLSPSTINVIAGLVGVVGLIVLLVGLIGTGVALIRS
jgi:hypothetical protein